MPIEILLVEDNVGDIRLTQEAFRPADKLIFLHVASDVEQAMNFLRQQGVYSAAPRPDLILLDLNLPELDGRSLLSDIKRDDDLQSIPVFVVTASELEDDVATSYRNGANGYHRKPVQWEEFEALVKCIHNFWVRNDGIQASGEAENAPATDGSMHQKPTRPQLQAKSNRVHEARMRAEQFIHAGGDLKSKEAVPIGMELSLAADDLAGDFGHLTLKDTK